MAKNQSKMKKWTKTEFSVPQGNFEQCDGSIPIRRSYPQNTQE